MDSPGGSSRVLSNEFWASGLMLLPFNMAIDLAVVPKGLVERCLMSCLIWAMPIFSSSSRKRSGLLGRIWEVARICQISLSRSSLFWLTIILGCIPEFYQNP